jgi:hypothetical protein
MEAESGARRLGVRVTSADLAPAARYWVAEQLALAPPLNAEQRGRLGALLSLRAERHEQ